MRNAMLEFIERVLAVEDNSKYSLASMEKVKTGSTPLKKRGRGGGRVLNGSLKLV